MVQVRVGFDPALPVRASATFTAGGRMFQSDDLFPWRELELSEAMLLDFWRSGLIRFELALIAEPDQTVAAPAERAAKPSSAPQRRR